VELFWQCGIVLTEWNCSDSVELFWQCGIVLTEWNLVLSFYYIQCIYIVFVYLGFSMPTFVLLSPSRYLSWWTISARGYQVVHFICQNISVQSTIPLCQNNSTLSKQFHTVRTIPLCQNNSALSEQFHSVRTIPLCQNNCTLSEQFHSVRTIPNSNIKSMWGLSFYIISISPGYMGGLSFYIISISPCYLWGQSFYSHIEMTFWRFFKKRNCLI
jgi:hypothetical protein